MNRTQINLQDNFLNQVRKEGIVVTVYLVSGVQLKGIVRGFDSFTVLLETPGKPSQLVYKHAMASVVPGRPVNLAGGREEAAEAEERPAARAEAPAPARAPAPAPAEAPAPAPVEPPAPAPVEPPAPAPVEEPAPAPVEEPAPAPEEVPAAAAEE